MKSPQKPSAVPILDLESISISARSELAEAHELQSLLEACSKRLRYARCELAELKREYPKAFDGKYRVAAAPFDFHNLDTVCRLDTAVAGFEEFCRKVSNIATEWRSLEQACNEDAHKALPSSVKAAETIIRIYQIQSAKGSGVLRTDETGLLLLGKDEYTLSKTTTPFQALVTILQWIVEALDHDKSTVT